MSQDSPFQTLIARVRAGDEDAATDLVRQYEPAIRRAVRIRLADSRLQRAFDSMDICQSVMGSFFMRVALGQYELDTPEQLLKLLSTMARNKLADQVERERAKCRDSRRVGAGTPDVLDVPSHAGSPSGQVAARELLEEVQRRLSAEEKELVELRHQGLDWAEVARQLGGSPEALRKRLARAIDRIARELGMDESSDE